MSRFLATGLVVVVLSGAHHQDAEVTGYLSVLGTDGRAVTGLRTQDLSAQVEGKIVEISALSNWVGPLSVVLLLDVTASHTDLPEFEVFDEYLLGLLESSDRVSVGSIGSGPPTAGKFSSSRAEIGAAIRSTLERPSAHRNGPSPIWDAVWESTNILESVPERRVIILVTDGRATANRRGFDEVLRRALQTGVTVTVVGQDAVQEARQSGSLGGVVLRPQVGLIAMAEATGGSVLFFRPPVPAVRLTRRAVGPRLATIIRALKASYVMNLRVPGEPGVRSLTVSVHRRDVDVWYRRYVAVQGRDREASRLSR